MFVTSSISRNRILSALRPAMSAPALWVDGGDPGVSTAGRRLLGDPGGPEFAPPELLADRLRSGLAFAIVVNPHTRVLRAHARLALGRPSAADLRRVAGLPAGSRLSVGAFVDLLASLPRHDRDWLLPRQVDALCVSEIRYAALCAVEAGGAALDGLAARLRTAGCTAPAPPITVPEPEPDTDTLTGEAAGTIATLYAEDFDLLGYPRDPGLRNEPPPTDKVPAVQAEPGGVLHRLLEAEAATGRGDGMTAIRRLAEAMARLEGGTGVHLFPGIRAWLARLLLRWKHVAVAEEVLGPCRQAAPRDLDWARATADLLERQHRPEEAFDLLLTACRRGIPEPHDARRLGRLGARIGSRERAVAAALALRDVNGEDGRTDAGLLDGMMAGLPTDLATAALDGLHADNPDWGGLGRLALALSGRPVPLGLVPSYPGWDRPAAPRWLLPPRAPAPLAAQAEAAADLREQRRQRLLRRVLTADPELFREAYYAARWMGDAPAGMVPLEHYIRIGSLQGRPPHPLNDAGVVLRRLLAADHPPVTAPDALAPLGRMPDLPASVRRELAECAVVHPELAPDSGRPADPGAGVGATALRAERLGRAFAKLRARIGGPFTHLVVVPWLYHPGGAERIGLLLMRHLRDVLGAERVVMYAAELPTGFPVDLPPDCRLVSLTDVMEASDLDDQIAILDRLIVEFAPRVVFNMHSLACWELFLRHRHHLRHDAHLLGIVFSNAVAPDGQPYGYSYYLPDCIDAMTAVMADNAGVRRELARRLPLRARDVAKIHVVHTPAPVGLEPVPPRAGKPRQTLWMSRFAMEKRMDVLAAVAARMPDRRHLVYGSTVHGTVPAAVETLAALPNVEVRGRYRDLSDIPADACDAFLYTSSFDGLPIVLLEATALGLPIVAPDIGGIGDFITGETGWLVSGPDALDEYVAALRCIESDPDLAIRKVRAAQRLLRERHGWAGFARSLSALPGLIGPAPSRIAP